MTFGFALGWAESVAQLLERFTRRLCPFLYRAEFMDVSLLM